MTDSLHWSCPTCALTVTPPFCARCGEQPPAALTLAWARGARITFIRAEDH